MTINNYIKIIEDLTKKQNGLSHFFVDIHDLSSYSHGPHHKGFFDKTESKLSIKDILEFLNKEGYKKVFGPAKITGGYVAYSFEKNAGYYTNDTINFDTTNGKFVRNVNREIITDKT